MKLFPRNININTLIQTLLYSIPNATQNLLCDTVMSNDIYVNSFSKKICNIFLQKHAGLF